METDPMAVQTEEAAMPTSKYQEIVDAIIAQIDEGALRPGDRLPSARQLREQFGCSEQPVRRAIDQLKLRRYVYSLPGIGVFVRP
jgi:DNA-binding GntR family transcriptional regulator